MTADRSSLCISESGLIFTPFVKTQGGILMEPPTGDVGSAYILV